MRQMSTNGTRNRQNIYYKIVPRHKTNSILNASKHWQIVLVIYVLNHNYPLNIKKICVNKNDVTSLFC